MKKKLLALSFAGILLSPITATGVQAATTYENDVEEVSHNSETAETFTNMEFLQAAELAYENGDISESEYTAIASQLSRRIGIKGVNKIVNLGNNRYDLYLNSLVSSIVVGLGGGAVGTVLSYIPGLNALASNWVISSVLSAAAATLADTSSGVIINYSLIPYTQANGLISHHTRINSIRDQ